MTPALLMVAVAPVSVAMVLEKLPVGAVVSITRAALAPRDPVAPGAERVRMALLPAASLMVPPLRVRAFAES